MAVIQFWKLIGIFYGLKLSKLYIARAEDEKNRLFEIHGVNTGNLGTLESFL